jgi:hypothetical protein
VGALDDRIARHYQPTSATALVFALELGMPYSKTSTGYPIEMKLAVEKVVEANQEMVVECDSPGRAKNLRGRYYQFVAACKRDATHPPSYWNEHEIAAHKAFMKIVTTVEFFAKDCEFHIRPRDLSPTAELLAMGRLIENEAFAVPATEQSGKLSAIEESAARLMEKQEMMAAAKKKLSGE